MILRDFGFPWWMSVFVVVYTIGAIILLKELISKENKDDNDRKAG